MNDEEIRVNRSRISSSADERIPFCILSNFRKDSGEKFNPFRISKKLEEIGKRENFVKLNANRVMNNDVTII